MTPEPLTDAERDFLRAHDGGLEGALAALLSGVPDPTPKTDAADAAAGVVAAIAARYPSRTERLLVLSALHQATTDAREALLDELLQAEFSWTYYPDKAIPELGEDGWRSVCLQPNDVQRLASLVGLTVPAVRRRHRKWANETLRRAMAEQGIQEPRRARAVS